MTLFNSTYSGGFSTYLSSNTLQNSSRHWSFSKGDRFFQLPPDNNAKYLSLPTIVNSRYTTFGFGERSMAKRLAPVDSPAPGQYSVRSIFDVPKPYEIKGKSFGISRNYYENVYIPHQDNIAPRISSQIPAPNRYSVLEADPIGKNAKKFSLIGRVVPPPPVTKDFPPPCAYKPVHILTEPSRYKGVSFGLGSRGNLTGSTTNVGLAITPGPGTYRLPSPFDKYTRISLLGKSNIGITYSSFD